MPTTHYLYRISFPDNSFYIGVTNNVERRVKAHSQDSAQYRSAVGAKIAKQGEDTLSIKILGEYPCKEEALIAESQAVNDKDPLSLNIIEGGGCPPSYGQAQKPISVKGERYPSIQAAAAALGLTRAQLDRRIKKGLIESTFLNKPSTIDLKGMVRQPKRQRCVFFGGERYNSYKQVCEKFNLTKDEYLNARKTFDRDHVTLKEIESLRIGKKPISLNGNEYQSRREALEGEKISNYQLYKVINQEVRSASKVEVKQIDSLTGKIVAVHKSLTEASQAVNAPNSSKICMCCRNQRNSAYGFKWEYASDPRVAI